MCLVILPWLLSLPTDLRKVLLHLHVDYLCGVILLNTWSCYCLLCKKNATCNMGKILWIHTHT